VFHAINVIMHFAMVLDMRDQLAITTKHSQDGRQKLYIILYNLDRVFVVVCYGRTFRKKITYLPKALKLL
jgi:hypothetical protein